MIVYDIDGTVLPGTSCERLFVRYLIKSKILRPVHFKNFCQRAPALLKYGIPYITKANKGYLRGFAADEMANIGTEFFKSRVCERISGKAIENIAHYIKSGERIILFSGMPDFLLANFSKFLNVKEYYGSIMEVKSGRFTGRTLGPFPLGEGKTKALELILSGKYNYETFSSKIDIKTPFTIPKSAWQEITFYADHWLDRFLLEKVGNPVIVNPRLKLRELARKNGWTVEIFD